MLIFYVLVHCHQLPFGFINTTQIFFGISLQYQHESIFLVKLVTHFEVFAWCSGCNLEVSLRYLGRILDGSWKGRVGILEGSWGYPGSISEVSCKDLRRVLEVSWKGPVGILEGSRRNPGSMFEVSWMDLGRVL